MDFDRLNNPLGVALQSAIMPGDQPGMPQMPQMPQMPKMGRGQMIMGIIADALAGAAGRPGPFAQAMQHRQDQEREEANWGRRLEQAEQIKARYREPDVAPALRDAQAWAQMTPEQRQAYQQMKQAGAGDPDVFVTLPNGQVYAGPRSGLSQALMGGAPQRPQVGAVVPDPRKGGPTPQASGGFRY